MEIQGNNLYEVNKQLSSQEPLMSYEQRLIVFKELVRWFTNDIDHYAMLLCHDRRDYTVFNVQISPKEAVSILFECFDNRGKLVSIDPAEGDAWEIWLRIDNEDFCYYLFNYDAAIIEC